MRKSKKEKPVVPAWMGNQPFSPDDKKPVIITGEMEVSTVYGIMGHQVSSQVYISTDKITLLDFTVPPGNYFAPPDIHGGAEAYYILAGKGAIFNPETGTVLQVAQEDGFYIPQGVWHQTYNFDEKKLKVLCAIAPQMWATDKMGSAIKFEAEYRFYQGQSSTDKIKGIGNWPPSTEEAKHNTKLKRIRPDERLCLIHGQENHILVSFLVSNNLVNMGEIAIPVQGYSDAEVHRGDEALYVTQGTLTVRVYENSSADESVSQRGYNILEGQKFLIPQDTKHQYLNFTDQAVKAVFAVAPNL